MERKVRQKAPLKPLEEVALAMVAKREYAVVELGRKLRAKGYGKAEVEALVADFVERGYVNDARFAAARTRSRAELSKWGQGRIRQELAMNGVEKGLVAETLEEFGEAHDWFAAASALLKRRFPAPLPVVEDAMDGALGKMEALQARQKEKAKRVNFLLRRGFSMEQALRAMGEREEI